MTPHGLWGNDRLDPFFYDAGGLLHELAVAPAGVPLVESHLRRIADLRGTDDVLLVVTEPTLGRQVLRPDGAPLRTPWQHRMAASAPVGLHLEPSPEGWDPSTSPLLAAGTLALQLDRFRRWATTDPLTGITNRRGFERALTRARERLERTGSSLTLVVIDVDGMKAVNDRAGHAAGDAVLIDIARELKAASRVTDAVARLGGDEFALLLEDAAPSSEELLIRRVERAVASTSPARVGLSWGAARAPEDSRQLDELMALADARMYEAKRQHRPREVGV